MSFKLGALLIMSGWVLICIKHLETMAFICFFGLWLELVISGPVLGAPGWMVYCFKKRKLGIKAWLGARLCN